MVESLISFFLEDIPDILAEIRRSIDENDFDSLCKYSHSLKGLLTNFGANEAATLACEIENIGITRTSEDARTLFSELDLKQARFFGDRVKTP